MVSGVLLFGFGLVLAALGFVLRELQKISADASKAALLLAKSRTVPTPAEPQAPAQAPRKPSPPLPPFEAPRAAPIVGMQEIAPETAPADNAADPAQSDLFSAPGEGMRHRPALAPAPALRSEEPATPATPLLPPLSWMIKPNQASAEELGANQAPDDWLNQAIAEEADRAARQETATREVTAREAPPVEKPAREAERALEREFAPDAWREGEKPAQPSPRPAPEVIGHYEAHGAHYTMYADGSIEAETQHGVYRFASIEELKRFIEGEDAAGVNAKPEATRQGH
jgi:hypothetical protein